MPRILLTLIAAIASVSLSSVSACAEVPPNIIVILADDLGYSDIHAGPFKGWVQTPQLARMAKQGLSFTDFHTNSSVCSPTRAALLTGRYQQRVGIVDVVARHLKTPGLDPAEFTLARMLKNRGYATAIFGKWHLGEDPKNNPVHHGFDEFRGYLRGYTDYHTHQGDWHNGLKVEPEPGYITHVITKNAVRYIEQNKSRPFFMCVAHQSVHLPFQTPDDTPENRKPIPKDQRWSRERIRPKYKVMIEEMDKGIGQILDTLDRLEMSERTLVIFLSDNGAIGAGNNSPWRGGKFSHFEGGHRVPLIARWTGRIQPNATTDALAVGMDLLPTFAQITGAKIPEDRALDGVSLADHLLGGEAPKPRRVFFGYEPKLGTALRDGPWKAILKGDRFALYHLGDDPGEKTDVAADHADRAGEMRRAIEAWRDQF